MTDNDDKGPWATSRAFEDVKAWTPVGPDLTDDDIIVLAHERYDVHMRTDGIFETAVDPHNEAIVERHEHGAYVSARVFMPVALLNRHGVYDPTPIEEDVSLPGPKLAALISDSKTEFVDDIKLGCARALDEHAEPRDPLWQRIATSMVTLFCVCVLGYYVGHGAGYKDGVHDVVAPLASALKSVEDPKL